MRRSVTPARKQAHTKASPFSNPPTVRNVLQQKAHPRRKFSSVILSVLRAPAIVKKLRISIVQYLNTAPLVHGFTHGPLKGRYDLSFTVPSRCADDMRAGQADVAILPAIELQRIDDLV